ncbi:NAD-dependent succinate-semialdehyde dehydrogenase [Geoalkalibacter halelectricus]|uniref:NAD-dependent succinate-semialdehyde dehydrogenase n=1 Tax=Geoalkalibacter halelectricus TaxID=2847045 RepID=A0ABY5ZHL7_9BACT|nr:NAD-dependent succinate-semialdehyde dehydrogenase [Geoalkalibacter halelectricus]MDO3380242.1 NAD-dependent succinate-semialdehyde dehydrogenase [Geoalkalibacter halelectricus]UWZ78191.1 NAD-dependent succinate-semialdehyde dehydrogenase [Geoalkalibacter halelectricus]
MALESINPATGELLEKFDEWSPGKTQETLAAVDLAWRDWRRTSFAERAANLRRAAQVLRQNKDEYARIMALEMGKPITSGRAEVDKCAWVCDYYAENAAAMLADEPAQSDGSRSYVAFRPLGMILAVMPWNFPFWQVFRFAAPALMAGNTGVLKHSSNVPRCALAIEDVFRQAGFPENVFRTLMIGANQVETVIENELIKAVTLTGSEAAGRKVAAKAGEMLKKVVLELGGSDPFIVLADADVEDSAETAAKSRCINSGQSCIAAKRFIIEAEIYDRWLEKFKDAMAALVVGDPLNEQTQLGPQAREDLMLELHGQVETSLAKGAELLLGGKPLKRKGYFYPPTILAEVKPGMPAYHEELFGPVASVIRVQNAEEAIEVANATLFGLGGSVWTRDSSKGETLAARIEAGAVFVNGLVKSDPRLPFGGIKNSGFGRELSYFGIRQFVNIQTVWVK